MQTMADDLQDAIGQAALQPRVVEVVDDHKTEQHSLGDLIKADKYLQQKREAQEGFGLGFLQLIPPGTV